MWKSASIQMVFFVVNSTSADVEELYGLAYSEEPTSVQKNRVVSPTNPTLATAMGESDGVQKIVQIQPGRVDFLLTPATPLEVGPSPEISFLPTESSLDIMVQAAERCADHFETLRVALVANLMDPIESYNEGAAAVAAMVGTNLALAGASDVMFQMNMSRPIDGDFRMNRLVRAGVMGFQHVAFQLGQTEARFPISTERFATSLMLDFNTVPAPVPFKANDALRLLRELHAELVRVANSDCPFVSITS